MDRAVEMPVTQHIGADSKLIARTAAEYIADTILGGEGGTVFEIQGTLRGVGHHRSPRRVRLRGWRTTRRTSRWSEARPATTPVMGRWRS